MSQPHAYSTLLKCMGCNALGAITWDLNRREAMEDRSFVGLNGEFHLDEARVSGHRMIVCSQCDAVYGPLPVNSRWLESKER
jgi:hypothetical protein